MTCKLNLLIFLFFVGVLGLNYYLSTDIGDSETLVDFQLSMKDKTEYDSARINVNDLTSGIKAKALNKEENGTNSQADSLANYFEYILSIP